MNSTQTISSPMGISSPNPVIQSPIKQPPVVQTSKSISYDEESKRIGQERLRYVLVVSLIFQYVLMMVYSLFTFNLTYLNPFTWLRETAYVFLSPLTVANCMYAATSLNKVLSEKVFCPTRISKFMQSLGFEAMILALNFFIGLFTARLFMRCLSDDYRYLTDKSNELNESYSFLLLCGVFMRFYFYANEKRSDGLDFPVVQQTKIQQTRKEFISIVKSSIFRTFMPTIHFIGFYVIFGSSFSYFLRRVFFLKITEESGFITNFMTLYDLKVVIFAWIMSAMILAHIQLFNRLTEIFATQSREFPIVSSNSLTITKALELSKTRITQHLAAHDLFMLADSANSARRKEFYALSVPGSHPHNWKQLVKVFLTLIDNFTNELKTNVDFVAKNRRNDATLNTLNNPIQKFYEHKQITRQQNENNGIRVFTAASPTKPVIAEDEKRSKLLINLKQRLLRFKLIAYLFGEEESAKLNFLLSQNSQIIIWTTQGIAALVARSLEEDSYGVVQFDIKSILKSLIKLKAALEKVSAINTIAKDRNLYALKSAVRRSIYRITTNFSEYFEDMMIDSEDLRALHGFITFKEL